MANHTLTLTGTPGSYKAALDGQDISSGIRRISIDVGPNDWPQVTAELAIHAIEVTELGVKDPRLVVSMPDEARDALTEFGWTPPITEAACTDWSMGKGHAEHEWDGSVPIPVRGRFTCPGWTAPAGER